MDLRPQEAGAGQDGADRPAGHQLAFLHVALLTLCQFANEPMTPQRNLIRPVPSQIMAFSWVGRQVEELFRAGLRDGVLEVPAPGSPEVRR